MSEYTSAALTFGTMLVVAAVLGMLSGWLFGGGAFYFWTGFVLGALAIGYIGQA